MLCRNLPTFIGRGSSVFNFRGLLITMVSFFLTLTAYLSQQIATTHIIVGFLHKIQWKNSP